MVYGNERDIKIEPINDYGCRICKAQATGYHFGAQSCSACAAFFRRTVALRKHFRCGAGNNQCLIHYSTQICRACRFKACLAAGMKQSSVQPKKSELERRRAFCTNSGLKRNKKFALRRMMMVIEKEEVGSPCLEEENTLSFPDIQPSRTSLKRKSFCASPEVDRADSPAGSENSCSAPPSVSMSSNKDVAKCKKEDEGVRRIECDVFKRLVKEEMKIGERRRIMFCERPVGILLGLTKTCITILRNCVLYHTILDPSYITVQIGNPERFVMHNGGYVSTTDASDAGWEDEAEISGETKKKIYKPLMRMMLEEIVAPMASMKITFEEFVALKAFISLQSTMYEVSSENRPALRGMLDALFRTLHQYYTENKIEVAERYGNLILLLSNVMAVGQQFVERHHEIAFFDLWQLDSLLLQLLRKE